VFLILTSQFAFIMHNVSKSALFSAERDVNVSVPAKRLSQTRNLRIVDVSK
jgi:hypothetical protein